jgi:membrane protease YdiL (CAAX protease family)
MSRDLSSTNGSAGGRTRDPLKAFLLVIGTIILFFLGQVIGVYIIIGLLFLFGYDFSQIQSLLTNNPALQFLTILTVEIITLGILWRVHRMIKQPFLVSVGLKNWPNFSSFGYSVLVYVVYFISLITAVALFSGIIPALDINQSQQIGFDGVQGGQLVFVFLTLVILPPIAEEIIFRGFLFQRLKRLITLYPAAIITSIIFALAHTEFLGDNPLNWIAAIDTFILSFFLIYLLQKTKSLWSSIFLHGIKNCIAFVALFLV